VLSGHGGRPLDAGEEAEPEPGRKRLHELRSATISQALATGQN
jgi:hypothetical protein